MRRVLTLAAVAGWLVVHAWLWTLLPPVPYARLPHGYRLEFADDGRRLIANSFGHIAIYDTVTASVIREWRFGRENFAGWSGYPCNNLTVSRDGRWAVAYSMEDHGDFLIDVENGRSQRLPGEFNEAGFIEFAPDQRHIVTTPGAEALVVWDVFAGRVKTITVPGRHYGMALTPDGRAAAIGGFIGDDNRHTAFVTLIDLTTGRSIVRDKVPGGLSEQLYLSADGSTLIAEVWRRVGEETETGVVAWSLPDLRRRAERSGARFCGWLADGRAVLRLADGDCVTTDADLKATTRIGSLSVIDSAQVYVFNHDPHIWVRHKMERSGLLAFFFENVMSDRENSDWSVWDCYDLAGRKLTTMAGCEEGSGELISNGRIAAVRSPDRDAILLYRFPPPTPGGFVLGLMIVEVTVAIAWSAWRRRRAIRIARKRNSAPAVT
jgi:hypothetical protein